MTAPQETPDATCVVPLLDMDWAAVRPPDIDSLTTHDGWLAFLGRERMTRPVELTRAQYEALTRPERRYHDIVRGAWHANLPKLETAMAATVRDELDMTLQVNLMKRDSGVRRGVIVSANSGHGKTTLILEILADHQDLIADLYKRSNSRPRIRDRHIPVVAVTCPGRATISKLCHRILDFYGMPYRRGGSADTEGVLADKVRRCLDACGTKVLFIDEISRLNMKREDAQITFDFIRDLQNSSATLVLAGVDIESTGLLTEGLYLKEDGDLKTQTEARFTRLPLPAFTYDTTPGIQAWVNHLHGIEQQIMLLDKRDGMLSDDLAEWLFDHTDQGVIGSLAFLIEQGCARAIQRGRRTGVEVLDAELLETVALDWAAEKRVRAAAEAEARGEKPGQDTARAARAARKPLPPRNRGSRRRTDAVYAGTRTR